MSFSSLSVTLSFIISVGEGKYTDVSITIIGIIIIILIIIMARFSLDQLHAGLHVNLYLHILQRCLSAPPSLWSLQGETGFHSIFCLPLCHASLCRVEQERAAPRSSSTRAQRPELHSAHTS